MRHPFIAAALVLACLFTSVFVYEFSIGLQHYGRLTDGLPVARLKIGMPDAQKTLRLEIWAQPTLETGPPLVIRVQPASLALRFHTLRPGAVGRLLGVEDRVKLMEIVFLPPGKDKVLSARVNGGRDLCHELLSLTGSVGALIASPGSVQYRFERLQPGRSTSLSITGALCRPFSGERAQGRH